MRDVAGTALTGLAFGFVLSAVGFSDYDELHKMFTFVDLRMLLTFGGAVVISGLVWALVRKFQRPTWSPRKIHPGTLAGGLIFGIGWAVCGACPSVAFIQIGEGQLGALLTVSGIFIGNWSYSVAHERWFRWSTGSCLDD